MRSAVGRTAVTTIDRAQATPASVDPGDALSVVIAGSNAGSRRRAVLTWAAEQHSIDDVVAGFASARRLLAGPDAGSALSPEDLDVLLGEALRVVTERAVRHALTDPLTGLGTRRAFTEGFATVLDHADRENEPVLVVLADIDGLKQVNDTRGHAAGDAVIRSFAQMISRLLRPGDAAYRLGGDEIVLLLPGATADAAVAIRQRLIAAGAPSASLGWAVYPHETHDPHRLLEIADSRLYSSKPSRGRAGRGRRRVRDVPLVWVAAAALALVAAASGVVSVVALQSRRSPSTPAATTPRASAPHSGTTSAPPRAVIAVGPRSQKKHTPATGDPLPQSGPVAALPTVAALPPLATPVTVLGPPKVSAPPAPSPTPGTLAAVVAGVTDTANAVLCTLLCPSPH